MLHYVHMDHLFYPDRLPIAIRSALKLDGELMTPLRDYQDTWQSRSFRVLSDEIHPLVLTGFSAVWALGAGEEPLKHNASTVTANRIRAPRLKNLVIEQRTFTAEDYWLDNAVGVTTPLRTVTDILRMHSLDTERINTYVVELFSSYELSQEQVMNQLTQMESVPYKRLALERCAQLKI